MQKAHHLDNVLIEFLISTNYQLLILKEKLQFEIRIS